MTPRSALAAGAIAAVLIVWFGATSRCSFTRQTSHGGGVHTAVSLACHSKSGRGQ